MTREEAITVLKGLLDNPLFRDTANLLEALEQEPSSSENPTGSTTKNDLGVDCMKKSDAINIIQDMHGLARADVIADAVNRVITTPPVTPTRPKGHWICDGKGRSFADYHCSECGLKLALCGQDIKQRQDSGYSLFCGGCGADMREVEE